MVLDIFCTLIIANFTDAPAVFNILQVLADGEKHSHAIMLNV